jgi:DNA-binding response OmpR family regulator
MRLLVVEDDPTISHFLVKGLREDQHLVDLAEDGAAGEARALAGDYDAILLDVMLPAQDGFAVCRRLRAQGVDTPILMVTARDTVGDRVRGLDTGADDYLVKPFAFAEVVARLRALTRRGRTPHLSAVLTAGALALDQDAHQAQVSGTPVPLTATEYRLLEFLMRRAGTIVSRDQLAEHVWGGEYDPCSNLADVYVGYLRKKLAGTAAAEQIRTIRGLGYMLARGND